MAKRFYLNSVNKEDGTVIWFTLVMEDPANFFVERCRDSKLPFIPDKITRIEAGEFDDYHQDDVSLGRLVKERLREIRDYQGMTPS